MAEPKTRPTGASVADFLDRAAPGARRADSDTVLAMMAQASGHPAQMWGPSIVGFGTYPVPDGKGKVTEWPLIGFSPRKTELVLYLMPGFEPLADGLARLGKHRTGASCLYIKRLADVDVTVLQQMIERSVQLMVAKHLK